MVDTSRDTWHPTRVRSYAGFRANERPLAFLLGDEEVQVVSVSASHREPDYIYFQVIGHDGRTYTLKHHEYLDTWYLKELKKSDSGDIPGV
jgi:hypothetical protein